MANAQVVIMVGRLTRDPELKQLPGGNVVANFGIAVNRQWTDDAGEKRDEVLFLEVATFGRTAEVVHEYRHKGGEILCDGYLRLEQGQDRQSGENRQAIKMVANRVQLIGNDGGGNDGGGQPFGGRGRPGGDSGWMDRGGRPMEREPQRDNRPQQRQPNRGSVAGMSYPRRQPAQNAPNQPRQNARQPAPNQPRSTNAPQRGQDHRESATNDRYSRGRSPGTSTEMQTQPGDFNPEDNEGGGYYGDGGYDDGEPPAIGGSQSRGEDYGDMQPLADHLGGNPGDGTGDPH
jgi:single-strand DNA-binding protein